jgi:hypothetical protein
VFFSCKEYHLYFLNFTFCIMELKSHSPSIFHLYILEFLYTTTLRVVLVKFFLDLGNSYLVFIVLSNAWYFNLLVSQILPVGVREELESSIMVNNDLFRDRRIYDFLVSFPLELHLCI